MAPVRTPAAAPAPETPLAPPPPACTAVVRASVHLRPLGVPQTTGPELPAGTRFEVLGVDPAVRRYATNTTGDEGVLSRVRVFATGRVGWTFLRYTELDASCPIRVARPNVAASVSEPGVYDSHYVRRGPRRRPAELVPCCARPPTGFSERPDPRYFAREDVDGDGSLDEIMRLPFFCRCWRRGDTPGTDGPVDSVVAVFFHAPDGWRAAEVMTIFDPIHPTTTSSGYEGTLRAGRVSYFRGEWDNQFDAYGCLDGRLPPRVHYDRAHVVLSRLHPDGTVRQVVHVPPLLAGDCTWNGLPDESVEVTCRQPRRRLFLRWDASAFQLIPEGGAVPYVDHDGPLCRREWDDDR